jgi:hypothetical protein
MNKEINKIGYWSGMFAFLAATGYVVVQLLQLVGITTYPLDGILIFGFSLGIVIPFIIEMLALHYFTPTEKKFWSHGALLFTILYAVFVTANYVVQLATVIPMKLQGSGDEVRVLDQTPHSMFWDFDALGYIFMGLATLFAIPVFEKQGIQKWVRGFFIANAIITLPVIFVYFYPHFTEKLVLLGLPWAITAPGSMLALALMFRNNRQQ